MQFINTFHSVLNNSLAIDMDHVQLYVYKNTPEVTFNKGAIFTVQMTFAWFVVFMIQHYLVILPFMHTFRKLFPSLNHWHEMSNQDKWWYTSYVNAILHAFISAAGSFYCLVYADGKSGTTWFTDREYRHTMYDIQVYLHLVSLGYIIFDLIFCLAV